MASAGLERWTALTFGASALLWGLTQLVGLFASLALLGGLAAGILALLAGRRASTRRTELLSGGAVAAAGHLLFVIAWIGSTPLNFKGARGTGVNQDPPAFFAAIVDGIGSWLPFVILIAIVVGFWTAWTLRERILGAAGLGLFILVLVMGSAGVGEDSTSSGLVLQLLFAAAFLLAAAAALLPVLMPTPSDSGPRSHAGPPARPPT